MVDYVAAWLPPEEALDYAIVISGRYGSSDRAAIAFHLSAEVWDGKVRARHGGSEISSERVLELTARLVRPRRWRGYLPQDIELSSEDVRSTFGKQPPAGDTAGFDFERRTKPSSETDCWSATSSMNQYVPPEYKLLTDAIVSAIEPLSEWLDRDAATHMQFGLPPRPSFLVELDTSIRKVRDALAIGRLRAVAILDDGRLVDVPCEVWRSDERSASALLTGVVHVKVGDKVIRGRVLLPIDEYDRWRGSDLSERADKIKDGSRTEPTAEPSAAPPQEKQDRLFPELEGIAAPVQAAVGVDLAEAGHAAVAVDGAPPAQRSIGESPTQVAADGQSATSKKAKPRRYPPRKEKPYMQALRDFGSTTNIFELSAADLRGKFIDAMATSPKWRDRVGQIPGERQLRKARDKLRAEESKSEANRN